MACAEPFTGRDVWIPLRRYWKPFKGLTRAEMEVLGAGLYCVAIGSRLTDNQSGNRGLKTYVTGRVLRIVYIKH